MAPVTPRPIAATVPYAQGKDFGDWLPAQLTVAKELWPADDPGPFDLKVNGRGVTGWRYRAS